MIQVFAWVRWGNVGITKRELTKEFDGLIEEMELDKMQLHLSCGGTAPKVVAAHRTALTAFAEHAMSKAVDALSEVLLSPDVIKACVLAKEAYGVYGNDPMNMIEQRLLGALNGRIRVATALQSIEHPVLNDIGLTKPEETGVLPELQNSLMRRMQVATELRAKRQRLQQKGEKS